MNKNKENKYPTLKVITTYTLLGGFVGSLVLVPIAIIFYNYPYEYGLMIIFVGSLFGSIPALFTAIVINTLRIFIKNNSDYCKVFIIGFICTFLSALIFMVAIINDFSVNLMDIIAIILMGLAGGISSTLLAKFLLPKS